MEGPFLNSSLGEMKDIAGLKKYPFILLKKKKTQSSKGFRKPQIGFALFAFKQTGCTAVKRVHLGVRMVQTKALLITWVSLGKLFSFLGVLIYKMRIRIFKGQNSDRDQMRKLKWEHLLMLSLRNKGKKKKKKVILGYLLSAKYYIKEYDGEQDNVPRKHILINKWLWNTIFFKK